MREMRKGGDIVPGRTVLAGRALASNVLLRPGAGRILCLAVYLGAVPFSLYLLLFSEIAPIHGWTHGLRHAFANIPCH